jgi:hypothetical protein
MGFSGARALVDPIFIVIDPLSYPKSVKLL